MTSGKPPPGLQAERTELAWERTAFGTFGTAALLTTRVPTGGPPTDLLPAAAALLLALILAAVGRWRRRGLTSPDGPVAAPAAVLVAGVGAAALGAMIAVLCLI
jgi:hypothetical protein